MSTMNSDQIPINVHVMSTLNSDQNINVHIMSTIAFETQSDSKQLIATQRDSNRLEKTQRDSK